MCPVAHPLLIINTVPFFTIDMEGEEEENFLREGHWLVQISFLHSLHCRPQGYQGHWNDSTLLTENWPTLKEAEMNIIIKCTYLAKCDGTCL